jgi:hypothetical protein
MSLLSLTLIRQGFFCRGAVVEAGLDYVDDEYVLLTRSFFFKKPTIFADNFDGSCPWLGL